MYFDYIENGWKWDNKKLYAKDISPNVIDLLINAMSQLPAPTRHVLSKGSKFHRDGFVGRLGRQVGGATGFELQGPHGIL
jgi:hypothetical protein